jgi:hypothetical protein
MALPRLQYAVEIATVRAIPPLVVLAERAEQASRYSSSGFFSPGHLPVVR